MDLGDFETTIKVIVVGNGGVGKSSMTARYCKGNYTDSYKKTIGVDFLEKTIDVGSGETVKLMIWDTAGQEEFDSLTTTYYRGAKVCAIVFSTIDRASFEAAEKWKRKVEDECGPITMVLVQNKVDLLDSAQMTPNEVEDMARRLNMKLYRASVKDNMNITEVFEYLAAQSILDSTPVTGSAVASAGDYAVPATQEATSSGSRPHNTDVVQERAYKAPAESAKEDYIIEENKPAVIPALAPAPTPVSTSSTPIPTPVSEVSETPSPSAPIKLTKEKAGKKKSALSFC